MKRLCLCVAALVMGGFLVVQVGCDVTIDGKREEAGKVKISVDVTKKEEEVIRILENPTTLKEAKIKLSDAKNSRVELKKIADNFYRKSESALRQIKRLEEEKEKSIEAFTKVQETARKAELPKLADATAEHKAKSIQIGTKTLIGEEIYRILKEYKAEVEKANAAIEREQTQSNFFKNRVEMIRGEMSRVDNNIAEMERKISDFEMYQELLKATATIKELGLTDDKMTQLLDTDNIMTILQGEIDEADIRINTIVQQNQGTDIKQELTNGASFSITDDDLI